MTVWTIATILRDNTCNIVSRVEARTWSSEWLDPDYLEYWPFGILTEKEILRIPPFFFKRRNATFHFCSGHRWILRESELVSLLFQYNNLQHRRKKSISQTRYLKHYRG